MKKMLNGLFATVAACGLLLGSGASAADVKERVLRIAYANGEGMKHYVNMVQEPEFAAREKGYTFVSHQQEVGAGYFDDVTTVIQGGSSSVKALSGSTEEEQFH